MSEALKKLQSRCDGLVADGEFGPNTARGIAKHFDLDPNRAAHLLGQTVHESGSFKYTEENLNYSKEAILRVFGKYFKTEAEAEKVERNPKALADIVYGGRGGNEGQGFAWRGRGFLQLTHRDNYRAFSSDMRIPQIMENPDLVASDYAMESAIWYFKRNNLWKICDEGIEKQVIKKVTKRVNGGYNGLDHRIKETQKIYEWLK